MTPGQGSGSDQGKRSRQICAQRRQAQAQSWQCCASWLAHSSAQLSQMREHSSHT